MAVFGEISSLQFTGVTDPLVFRKSLKYALYIPLFCIYIWFVRTQKMQNTTVLITCGGFETAWMHLPNTQRKLGSISQTNTCRDSCKTSQQSPVSLGSYLIHLWYESQKLQNVNVLGLYSMLCIYVFCSCSSSAAVYVRPKE